MCLSLLQHKLSELLGVAISHGIILFSYFYGREGNVRLQWDCILTLSMLAAFYFAIWRCGCHVIIKYQSEK